MLATAAQSEAAIALACADGNLKLDSEEIKKRFQKTACQTKHQNLASSHTLQAGQHSINTICGSVVFQYLCAYAMFQTGVVPSITVAYTHTCRICFLSQILPWAFLSLSPQTHSKPNLDAWGLLPLTTSKTLARPEPFGFGFKFDWLLGCHNFYLGQTLT